MLRPATIGIACLWLPACGAPEQNQAYPEEYVDAGPVRFFFAEGTEPPCAGTAPFLADMAQRIADYLGVTVPRRIEYHYHPDPDLSKVCGKSRSYAGCSFPGEARIWATDATTVHELVHAIADQNGEHYGFLAEGLAIALGEQNALPRDYTADAATYLTPDTPGTAQNGGLFGDFTSSLLVEFGPKRFMELYNLVDAHASADDFKRRFEEIYSMSFDDVLEQRRVASLRFPDNRLRFPECTFPPLEWNSESWSWQIPVDCRSSAIGPSARLSGHPATAWLAQTLELPPNEGVLIDFSGAVGEATLYSCESPFGAWSLTDPWQTLLGEPPIRRTLTTGKLTAGHYALLVNNDERNEPAAIAVTIATSLSAEPTCAAEPPLRVAENVGGLRLISEVDAFAEQSFELSEARAATALFSKAEVCDEACSSCAVAPAFDGIGLDARVTYSLRVLADPFRQTAGVQLVPR